MLLLEDLVKRFGDAAAVDGVSLEVGAGELLTLLGPSGCGKTTTLRMIAGFETPTSGRIRLQDRDITYSPPQRRGVGMVFQNYALFPHLDVFENVAFGLKARRLPGAQIRERVARALERVDLAGYERRRVQQLSGGEQQRVAVARALAPEPPVLLLDEPLSNLDAALRERTRGELRTLLKRLGITSIFVTHDQEEAYALSDRIAVMHAGRLQQVGSPESLYASPANAFVASFLGRANFMAAEVVGADDAGGAVHCRLADGAVWRARLMAGATAGDRVRIMVRPESLRLAPRAQAGRPASGGHGAEEAGDPASRANADLLGTVLDRRFSGATTLYRVRAGQTELLVLGGAADARGGEDVAIRPIQGAAVYAFPAEP